MGSLRISVFLSNGNIDTNFNGNKRRIKNTQPGGVGCGLRYSNEAHWASSARNTPLRGACGDPVVALSVLRTPVLRFTSPAGRSPLTILCRVHQAAPNNAPNNAPSSTRLSRISITPSIHPTLQSPSMRGQGE